MKLTAFIHSRIDQQVDYHVSSVRFIKQSKVCLQGQETFLRCLHPNPKTYAKVFGEVKTRCWEVEGVHVTKANAVQWVLLPRPKQGLVIGLKPAFDSGLQ